MVEPKRDPETAAALARLYDLDLVDEPGDLDLYLALVARTGGPVLELGVGSGRIALALAEAGYEVTGVDLDAAMLERLQRRLADAPAAIRARVEIVQADLVELHLPGDARFRLCVLALNSILALGSREAQRAALETMSRHLADGGLAVVDVWLPAADELARYDDRLELEYVRPDPDSGLLVTKTTSALYEPAAARVLLTALYEEGEQGKPPRRWIRQDWLQLVGAAELRSLAEDAGLEVEVVAGSYDLSPIGSHDDRAILVGRRRERTRAATLL
jgi:SAM-dependent methyltransferase